MLSFTYLGFGGGSEGWYETLLAQPSRETCFAWGEWLGRRYRDWPNVLWFALGDYTPPSGSEGEARARAIIDGIKAAGARQLFLAEPSGPTGIPTLDAKAFADVVDLSSFYGYGRSGRGECYEQADAAFRISPPKPAWVQEGGYEFEDNTGGFTGESYETRRTRFWAVLGGGRPATASARATSGCGRTCPRASTRRARSSQRAPSASSRRFPGGTSGRPGLERGAPAGSSSRRDGAAGAGSTTSLRR